MRTAESFRKIWEMGHGIGAASGESFLLMEAYRIIF